jgi:hypothetical protein
MGAAASIPPEFLALDAEKKQAIEEEFNKLKSGGKTDEEAIQHLLSTAPDAASGETSLCVHVIALTALLDAIEDIVSRGKTPLVIDNSPDDKVNSFFSYRSALLIDGKQMGLNKSLKKVPVKDIMEEARQKLVNAIKYGYPVIFALTKSVTDFATTFNDDVAREKGEISPEDGMFLPVEVFRAAGKGLLSQEYLDGLFRDADREQGIAFSRSPDTFRVIITSQFAPEDYEEYLFGNDYGLIKPKDLYEVIIIKDEQ